MWNRFETAPERYRRHPHASTLHILRCTLFTHTPIKTHFAAPHASDGLNGMRDYIHKTSPIIKFNHFVSKYFTSF